MLDFEKLVAEAVEGLPPEFREMPFDPGNKYSVPWLAGFVGITYNAEMVGKRMTVDEVLAVAAATSVVGGVLSNKGPKPAAAAGKKAGKA